MPQRRALARPFSSWSVWVDDREGGGRGEGALELLDRRLRVPVTSADLSLLQVSGTTGKPACGS